MKIVNIFIVLIGTMMLSSFSIGQTESTNKLIGTYGEKSMHQLTLNEDQTFHYIQIINNNKTDITGNWNLTDNEINLIDLSNERKALTKWKVQENSSCLKAKKRFTTYTICRNCK